MISVIVTYQVKPEFSAQNKANIQRFLADFETLDNTQFKYTVLCKEDGVSFVHFSQYQNKEIQDQFLNVPSFKLFQELRDASGLNDSHHVEVLDFVGSKGTLK
ncbi:hypothetical protein [Fluviicola sp.]|uniref:hypothetical protein n=1 Tax=Fluviicola sp. TaxID=1917219 RepID=UPI002623BCAC|nr:hypothetical protein [Fluviicola sp.]